MGNIYVTDAADIARAEGITNIKEWPGWKTRGAGQGGFASLMGVIIHHTASPVTWRGDKDWAYTLTNTSNAPEYLAGIDPDGRLNLLCAGGANSSGRGGSVKLSTGTVPQTGANYRLIAVCFGNLGTGAEPYTAAALDTAVRFVGGLCKRFGWDTGAITAHKEWCGPGTSTPGRKIDPYGPWAATLWGSGLNWGPHQGRIDTFRGIVFNYLVGVAPPQPTPTPPKPTPPKPTPPATNWPASLTSKLPTIKKGARGIQVKRMQHLLAAHGFMNESNTSNYDGVWGNGTESAKVRFDNAKGLTPSPPSDCGAKSWAALCGSMPTLVKGSTGGNVKIMQHMLAANGFMNEGNVSNYDGKWGNGTDGAKQNFDRANGLSPSPPTDCGPRSWAKLLGG